MASGLHHNLKSRKLYCGSDRPAAEIEFDTFDTDQHLLWCSDIDMAKDLDEQIRDLYPDGLSCWRSFVAKELRGPVPRESQELDRQAGFDEDSIRGNRC